jgi:hypothetical protein
MNRRPARAFGMIVWCIIGVCVFYLWRSVHSSIFSVIPSTGRDVLALKIGWWTGAVGVSRVMLSPARCG